MKNLNRLLIAVFGLFTMIAACTKEGPLPTYTTGNEPILEAMLTRSTPRPADSNKYVFQASWTNPKMATDWSNVKFITQIDVAGNNFRQPLESTVFGGLADSMQAKTINKFLLDRGYPFDQPVALETRLVASYSNNNDMKYSNSVPLTFTVYKVPPKVALPSSGRLYLVGSATQGSWTNPVPVPTQQFARIDETTWAGVFQLYGGAQYLVLPVNGSWDNKFSVADNSLAGLAEGGDFGFNLPDNFPGPAADGIYKITLDFQQGKFKVEPFTQAHGLPSTLVMVGGATPGGWDNSVGNTQKLIQLNSAEWQINSIYLKANDSYLILPEPGSWSKKYGVPDRSVESARMSGTFIPEGQDFKSPTEAGNYKIRMNFATETYQLTKL